MAHKINYWPLSNTSIEKGVEDVIQIQNLFLTAQSTQIKSVISVPIKDFNHHYPRALFNDIPRVGTYFYDIPGSGCLLRHTRVGGGCEITCLILEW